MLVSIEDNTVYLYHLSWLEILEPNIYYDFYVYSLLKFPSLSLSIHTARLLLFQSLLL